MVASVPMTPTFLFLVLVIARRTPGSITPMTGTAKLSCKRLSAMAVDVLHATTTILTPFSTKNSLFSKE